ncbi:hypothetical protein CCR94_16340 [Rhodoblastus sphagnicola]|uniref:Portal protein n=1 Tax=Rhodoblastus sphagnicola TaxID=333368 RepID=A0A2S6N2X7_9HYPH|nr:DUF935 domain-containing protein [Rhodoblastus sphagnicola]MBB4199064.1 phage gp29-like protein [Rhodoblastus sphagnicola]PPQ28959.1 hypothetical protein CCR94_16340 [Rhodoblastus sphagnicola]
MARDKKKKRKEQTAPLDPMQPRVGEAPEGEVGMHGPSPLLEDGQIPDRELSLPEVEELSEELARPELIGVRSFWDQSVASGLSPERLASILQNTKRGDLRSFLELAEEMEERDLHYLAVLSTRKRQVARLKPSIEEGARNVDKRIVDAVRELVAAPAWRSLMKSMVDAFGKGFSVTEIMWAVDDGLLKPVAYVWRDPKYFTFDYVSRTEARIAVLGAIDGAALPPAKFVVHKPEIKSGIPIRGGYAWLCAWSWLFKQFSLKDWMTFLDVYGMPLRVGKYHPGATAEDKRKLLQAVSRIAVDAAAIIPETMVIEFLEAKGYADKPFATFADYLDKQISKAILGQTMTTDGQAGGLAQAKVHDEVRIDILEDDAEEAELTVNRDVIRWFVQINFGAGAKAPWVKFPVAEPQDIAVKSTAIATLVNVGLEVAQAEAREIVGLREPAEGEKLLRAAAKGAAQEPAPDTSQAERMAATNAQGRCACGCGRPLRLAHNASAPATEPDVVDAIGEDEADEWEAQLGPIVEQVEAELAQATGFDDFLARLDRLAGKLKLDPLAKRLMISAMKARGFGEGSGPGGRLDG